MSDFALEQATFKNGPNSVAADLRVPTAGTEISFPAIVIATPGSSMKGQIGANYSERLAERGSVTLAFDPSHQGERWRAA